LRQELRQPDPGLRIALEIDEDELRIDRAQLLQVLLRDPVEVRRDLDRERDPVLGSGEHLTEIPEEPLVDRDHRGSNDPSLHTLLASVRPRACRAAPFPGTLMARHRRGAALRSDSGATDPTATSPARPSAAAAAYRTAAPAGASRSRAAPCGSAARPWTGRTTRGWGCPRESGSCPGCP